MRNHYWSCSTFADWLRGTVSPKVADSNGWTTWEKTAKESHPFRYWLADTGLDVLQDIIFFIPDKLYEIKYYINNRWITRTHSLTAHPRNIRPGTWCDVGNRFLPCLFNELVDFVEIELAWMQIAWGDKELKKKYDPPFWATGWFKWRTWRCPQAGIDNLEWQKTLIFNEDYCKNESYYMQPTPQAVSAQEVLELYRWWTEIYPNRPDPYDASGWSEHCDHMREKYGKDSLLPSLNSKDPKDQEESSRAHALLREIEESYEKEDTEMMCRLIKIRNSLWT